ncbi:hypothetical protein AX15_006028 [Amanita polypyramis BW_CC]|nr:hypothetical protein AX15_006028 [Amanita polypyramis BW_CC]
MMPLGGGNTTSGSSTIASTTTPTMTKGILASLTVTTMTIETAHTKLSKGMIALIAVICILAVGALIGPVQFHPYLEVVILNALVLFISVGIGICFRLRKAGKNLGVRSLSECPAPSTPVGLSSIITGTSVGSPRPAQKTLSDRFDTRKPGNSPEHLNELEKGQLPQVQPQSQVNQPKERLSYRILGHPYQAVSQEWASTGQANAPGRSDMRMRPAALELPINSFAAGSGPSCSPRSPPSAFSNHTIQRSTSSSTHMKTDSAGSTRRSEETVVALGQSRMPARPPVAMKNLVPPERRLSISFLSLDDGESTCSNVAALSSPALTLAGQANRKSEQQNANKGVINSTPRLMTAAASYKRVLHDELSVKVGDVMKVLREYDDGWCIVEQIGVANAQTGAVPRICLQEQL